MLPIGPLMIEHRVIERMILLMKTELANIAKNAPPDLLFIDTAVDFIRTYADQCHHGKEEDILFKELRKKPLAPDHLATMNELIEEHRNARNMVKKILEAKDRLQRGAPTTLQDLVSPIAVLIEFYPKHIDKEDNHFFRPCMDYFSESERSAMLKEFYDFDRKMIHRRYKQLVEDLEKSRGHETEKNKGVFE